MSTCQAKRGIFTLQVCGEPASATCAACGIPLCPDHLYLIGFQGYCARCHSTQDPSLVASRPDDVSNWSRPGWAQRWRDDYHQRSHYHPFHHGSWGVTYFVGDDYAALGNQDPGAALTDDDGGAGFSDS
jgi:hypothetical protein